MGVVQAGFERVAHLELPGGFGMENTKANTDLLGKFETQVGSDAEWEPYDDVAFLFGNPPCSGFSMMNTAKKGSTNFRGPDSPINNCMWALVEYASRCRGTDGKLGPDIVAFESVQGAGTSGRNLMRRLRDTLILNTGRHYDLTHVFMNAAHCGGAQERRRYFFVAHSIPFGVTVEKTFVPYVWDAIQDLLGLQTDTWERQALRERSTKWARETVGVSGLAGITAHIAAHESNHARRMSYLYDTWEPRGNEETAARLRYAAGLEFPPPFPEGFDPTNKRWGFYQTRRLSWQQQGWVLAGNACTAFVHPEEDRLLTVREASRLMGYPDAWDWRAAGSIDRAQQWLGKGLVVQAGRWFSEQVRNALEGGTWELDGQSTPAEKVEPGLVPYEYVINTTNIHKPWIKEQRS